MVHLPECTVDAVRTLTDSRDLIEAALVYAGGTHTYDDVITSVEKGEAQFWPGPRSCVITEVEDHPSRRILVMFLAAGSQVELMAMEPGIIAWGKEQGCTQTRLVGRKGWGKSFLAETGWRDSGLIIMEKDI